MGYPNFKDKCFEEALFSPSDYVTWSKHTKNASGVKPSKYILVYYPYLMNYFKRKYKPRVIKLWRLITIYQIGDVGLVQMTGIGAPNASTVLEELIALGGGEFINIGSCGGLNDFGIFLCKKALRDEGVSHHYLPRGKYTFPDSDLTSKFGQLLASQNIDFKRGVTWTIDAPYRETLSEIEKYRGQNISTVEMEASALFAVGKFRNVKVASCFVVSDILGKDKWDPQFDSKHVKDKLKLLVDVAVELFSKRA